MGTFIDYVTHKIEYLSLNKLGMAGCVRPSLSPEMSPYPILCSQIMAIVASGDLVTGLREP